MNQVCHPTVSVVIPALNAAEWIGFTLESICEQTYPTDLMEVIVVDDGSVDGTAEEAARRLEPSGLVHAILRNDSPQGPGAARNRGWRHASGTWIQFLDADDLLRPRKIEVQATAAAGVPSDVAVIFSPWARLCYANGVWSPARDAFKPSIGADPTLDLLRAEHFIATGSQLIRRIALERVGGYVEAHRFVEDVDLLLRIAFDGGEFCAVPSSEPLFLYRHRPDSVSSSNERALIDGCVRNARTAERHWLAHNALTPPRAKAIADVYFMAARYLSEHDLPAFSAIVSDINRLCPGFTPEGPPALRMLTRVLGYPAAERCAVQYRRLKRSVRGRGVA